MAISAAKVNKIPVMLIPSMHQVLADDSVTQDLSKELNNQGFKLLWGEIDENKSKQPDPISIVANFSHHVNSYLENRKNIVITLGSTISFLDDISRLIEFFLENS